MVNGALSWIFHRRCPSLLRNSMTTPVPTAKDNHAKAKEILLLEAEALVNAAENLDRASVENAVSLLANCTGKAVVVGAGKSGVIAQKIAQTLSSTGTMALFLHPSDGLHGGLGIVAPDDVVIALSNSGETDEILALLPVLISV